ncbi:MAG TPA: SDR family NAD(P)-dependent oxidoreductase [Ktedonobacterales bacterium]
MAEIKKPRALFDIHGRTAVVTGGSGVLGRTMARGLAAAGARVAVLGRRFEACEAVAQEIRAEGGEAVGVACDVLNRDSIERAEQIVTESLNPVDILVNAAGGNAPAATTSAERSFFDLSERAIEDVVRLNLNGSIACSQVFGKVMAAHGSGSIVNIASMNAIRPLSRIPAYSASKAAVVNFTQWLAVHMAQEYDPRIRVNALAPGFFLTEQNRFLLTDQTTGEWTARGAAIVTHTPAGRLGSPEDLIAALLWLVGPGASFVTGAVIPVDGGFSAYSGV